MGLIVESIKLIESTIPTIMKVAAIFFCFFISLVLAFPGETGPNCDGYICGDEEKCCIVNGNYFCAPTWQSCYKGQFEDFEKSKASETTEKEVVSGVLVDLKKQCARYTGNNVHNAHDCAVVCGQGGYSTYSYWPTFNICCCDCGTTPCF